MKNKKSLLVFPFTLALILASCETSSSISSTPSSPVESFDSTTSTSTPTSEEEHLNSLQSLLKEMRANNFSVEVGGRMYDPQEISHSSFSRTIYKYNDYSVEASGDGENFNYAMKDETLFRYTYDSNGEITASAPYLDSGTGLRYESYYDFRISFENFNYLSSGIVENSDGTYTYSYNVNSTNDLILEMMVRGQSGLGASLPKETIITVVGRTIQINWVVLTYNSSDEEFDKTKHVYLENQAIIYDIGSTENEKIKEYLVDGGAYDPIDMRFSKLINPYLYTHNYTIEVDGSGTTEGSELQNDVGTYYFNEEGYMFEYPEDFGSEYTAGGYLEYKGIVSSFKYEDETKSRIQILAPQTNSDAEVYTDFYGEFADSFDSLELGLFQGYKDPIDENRYHITYSEAIVYICYIFNLSISETTYTDDLIIDIIDDTTHEFRITLNLIDDSTDLSLGTMYVNFSGLNNTTIPGLSRLLNEGDDPTSQTSEEFQAVMDQFKNHNYTMDVASDIGIANRMFTDRYVFNYLPSQPSSSYGYIQISETEIYEFTIDYENNTVLVDEGAGNYYDNGMRIPGHGTTLGTGSSGSTDAGGYVSTFDAIFDYTKYSRNSLYNFPFWQNTSANFSSTMLTYIAAGASTSNLIARGAGFTVSNSDDAYDRRVSLHVFYITNDGSQSGYTTWTYYNIGNTGYEIIDNYLDSLGV